MSCVWCFASRRRNWAQIRTSYLLNIRLSRHTAVVVVFSRFLRSWKSLEFYKTLSGKCKFRETRLTRLTEESKLISTCAFHVFDRRRYIMVHAHKVSQYRGLSPSPDAKAKGGRGQQPIRGYRRDGKVD